MITALVLTTLTLIRFVIPFGLVLLIGSLINKRQVQMY